MNTKKQWIAMLLMLAMLFAVLPMTAFAEDPPAEAGAQEQEELESSESAQQGNGTQEANTPAEEKKGTITATWLHYDTGKGYYNPEDTDKEVTLALFVLAEGENAQGEREEFWFMYNPVTKELHKPTKMQIGHKYTGTIPLNEMTLPNGKVYKNISFTNTAYLHLGAQNRIYGASFGNQPSKNLVLFEICQNMQTLTTLKIAQGTTILEDDKPNMNVRYWIQKSEGNGPREIFLARNGNPYEETRLFQEGELDFIAKKGNGDRTFRDAVWQNAMNQYNPYTGRYKEFYLKAEWTGPHKEELNKRYNLDVKGNDLDGWTVTLSNRPPEKPQKPDRPFVPSVKELILFDANGGAWENGETRREYRSAVGSVITIETAPTREGYKFLYWKGSEYQPGENYTVPAGGHTFVAQWEKVEKPEDNPAEKPSVDPKIKTPRGSILTADEIAKILASTKRVIPAIPKAGVGR